MGNNSCDCFFAPYQSEPLQNASFPIENTIQSKRISPAENLPSNRPKTLRSKEQSMSESEIAIIDPKGEVGIPAEFSQLYALGELVGIGTTSKVYKIFLRARRNGYFGANNTNLACKVIHKKKLTMGMDSSDIDPLLVQLRREVEILRRISHPNIVSFYDYIESPQKIFIITEHLSGGELFDYVVNNGPLPEKTAMKVLYGVFSAVVYLHDRGVVHRDIKAENVIFFKQSDNTFSLKLIDFGFSTIIRHNLTGSFLGTGGYIAPEIRQNKYYNMSVDNWALGVLLYCTLSAKLPFTVSIDSLPHTNAQCMSAFTLFFPEREWGRISSDCKELIRGLLQFDPMQRLSSKDAIHHKWFKSMHAKQTSIKRTADDPNFTLENKPSSLRQNAVSFVTEEDLLAMRAISQNYEAKASPTRKQQSISTPNPLSDASSEFSRMSDTSVDSQRRMKAVLTSELPLLHSPLRPVKSSSQLFQSKQYLATDENHRAQSVTESNTITFPFRSRQNSIQKDHNSAEALVYDENLTHSIGKKTKIVEVEFETDADTDAGFASKQKDHIVYLNDLNMQMDDLSSDSSFEYFDIVATSAAHEEMFMTSLLDSNMATQIASDMNDLRGKMDETKSLDDYASPKFRLLVDLSDQKLSSAEKLSNLIRMPPEATSTIFGNENVTNKIKYPHSYCPGYMINTTGTSTTSTLTTVTTVTSNHTSPTTLFPKLPLNDIEGNGSMGLLQDRLRNFGPNQKEYSTRFDQSNKPYNSNTIHNNSAGDLIYSTRRSTLHRF